MRSLLGMALNDGIWTRDGLQIELVDKIVYIRLPSFCYRNDASNFLHKLEDLVLRLECASIIESIEVSWLQQ